MHPILLAVKNNSEFGTTNFEKPMDSEQTDHKEQNERNEEKD